MGTYCIAQGASLGPQLVTKRGGVEGSFKREGICVYM